MVSIDCSDAHINNFVMLSLLEGLSSGLSANISALIGQEARCGRAGSAPAGLRPSFCLSSVLGAAIYTCTTSPVADEVDLEYVLDIVRGHFEVVEPCAEADQRTALASLEQVFQITAAQARDALAEAAAGFPLSGGDFAVWRQCRATEASEVAAGQMPASPTLQ